MSPTHLPQHVASGKSTQLGNETSGSEQLGISAAAPAFQLKASTANPVQRKTPEDGHEHDAQDNLEGFASEMRWDAIVISGAASLMKTPTADVSALLDTIPENAIVGASLEKDGFVTVRYGTKEGWVEKSKLQQVSYRLSRHEDLMEVMRGNKSFKLGDKGTAVTVVQQLFADTTQAMQVILKIIQNAGINTSGAQANIKSGKAGMLPSAVTGVLDAPTETVLKLMQQAMSIPETGAIDKETVEKLNKLLVMEPYAIERIILRGQKDLPDAQQGVEYTAATTPPELLEGTHKITSEQQAAFEAAISTESKAIGGGVPTFVDKPKGTYGKKIRESLEATILKQYEKMGKGKGALRADKSNLHDWPQIDKIATKSAEATDKTFGKYRRGPALSSQGVDPQIRDAWERKEQEMKDEPIEMERAVHWRVNKILNGDEAIKAIDKEHGAVQTRDAEAKIIKPIKDEMMKKYRTELIETHKGWGAFAEDDKVFIQRFLEKDDKGVADPVKGRAYMWKMFRTIIHEYLHTLEHTEHRKFRDPMKEKQGGFALREGTTDYFTKVAYNNTNLNDLALRKEIEGPFHDPGGKEQISPMPAYGESQNIEAAVGIIGFPNMCAAFFLGRTDLYKA